MTDDEKLKTFGACELRKVRLADLRREDGAQVRESLDERALHEYARLYQEGARLPPVVLFDDDGTLRIADGFHRLVGAGAARLEEIDAEVYRGDHRLAQLYATQANAEHGVRRSDETVRRAVRTLLEDPEWSQWTDRAIAAHVDCSPTTVGKQRRLLEEERQAAAGKGNQTALFGEPTAPAPALPVVRKGADGRTYDVSGISRAAEEERIKKAIVAASDMGKEDAADPRPRSRLEMARALKKMLGAEVPEHALPDLYQGYTAERERAIELRERAAELAAVLVVSGDNQPPAAEPEEPAKSYRPILGGDAGKALQDRPLATPAIGDLIRQEARRLEATYQPRIAELERDLRLAEQRFRREQEVNTALLTAITRTAALWRGEHDGPRAQLLALLEEQGQQDAAAQWDRALQRAAALGRHEGAAALDTIGEESAKLMEQVADLQKQLGAAKEDARLLRQQVQELEQDAAARRQRARQVLCEEPDCGRYTEAPQGGGLALCDHHRPGVPLRPWREVYPLSASAPELLECPKTWEDLGAALVMCTAGWGGDMLADAETLAAAAIEKGLDGEEVNLRADLRPAELAALLRGVERELKTPTSGPWSAEAQNDDLEPPRGKGPCNTRCLATTPEGGARGHRYCTRDLGHDDRHRYEEPDNDETREKIEKVLAARRQAQEASAKPAPKGRKARAPKAEPAPAPQAQAEPPPPTAPASWAAASIGGSKSVHAVDAAALAGAEESGDAERDPAAKCGQRPDYKSKGWTRRPGTKLTCNGCRRAVESEVLARGELVETSAEPRGNLTQEQRRALFFALMRPAFESDAECDPKLLMHERARLEGCAWRPLCESGATDDEIAAELRRLIGALYAQGLTADEEVRETIGMIAPKVPAIEVGPPGARRKLSGAELVRVTRQALLIPERQAAQEVSRG